MQRCRVVADLPELDVVLPLDSINDLHPDAIVRRLPAMGKLLARRETPPAGGRPVHAPAVPPLSEQPRTGGSILDAVLGETQAAATGQASTADASALQQFVQQVAAPLIDRTDRDALAAWQARVDRALGEGMRAVLYHPRFRALETVWRGLYRLVTHVETAPDLEIRLLDARPEVAADRLRERILAPGVPRPAAILGCYRFGPSADDLTVLRRIAEVARTAGTSFIADASPALLGLDDVWNLEDPAARGRVRLGGGCEGWSDFQRSDLAGHVMLCLPRVLLRLPFGPLGEEVLSFGFAEDLQREEHEKFLWGNGSLIVGGVLARAFAAEGWDGEAVRFGRVGGLPLHVVGDAALPCAEVLMSDATIRAVMEQAVVVLASVRDDDAVECRGLATVDGRPLRLGG